MKQIVFRDDAVFFKNDQGESFGKCLNGFDCDAKLSSRAVTG